MKTVLIVDDDIQLREMLKVMLLSDGYQVIEAESGALGLKTARQFLPDLILSDIHMPGGDGSTLLRDIRNDPELKSKQVVLMTGRPDLVTPRKSMEEGADDFLIKPVSRAALLACLKSRFSRAAISWRIEDQTLSNLRSRIPPNLPHEFFTPMAGIIGLMDILRADRPPFLTPAEVDDIHTDIYTSALRLNRTLKNYLLLLDMRLASPIEAAKEINAKQVAQQINLGIAEALRLNHRKPDVTVRLHARTLAIKPDDLSQIVEELVDNACKFSREGTAVTVELTEDAKLIISDHGRGMTSEEIKSIGAFQQFDRKKYEQQGLGLGLILLQHILARCGSEFSIQSHPGRGTRVEVCLS